MYSVVVLLVVISMLMCWFEKCEDDRLYKECRNGLKYLDVIQ